MLVEVLWGTRQAAPPGGCPGDGASTEGARHLQLSSCPPVSSAAAALVFLCPLGCLVESQVTTLGYNCWFLLLYDYRVVKGCYFLVQSCRGGKK